VTDKTAHSVILAIASWIRLEGAVKETEACALCQDPEGLERARRRAHDVLDTHIDMKLAAITALRLKHEER
jgi:hypothetical protein